MNHIRQLLSVGCACVYMIHAHDIYLVNASEITHRQLKRVAQYDTVKGCVCGNTVYSCMLCVIFMR